MVCRLVENDISGVSAVHGALIVRAQPDSLSLRTAMHEMRTGTDAYVYKGHFPTKAATLKYWQSQVSLTTVCYPAPTA